MVFPYSDLSSYVFSVYICCALVWVVSHAVIVSFTYVLVMSAVKYVLN